METTTFVILIKWEPSNIKTQNVIFYKSVQELNGNTFVLSLTLPVGVKKAKVAWYEMGMSWEEGSGNTNWNYHLTFNFDIELRTSVSSNSLSTYHKNFTCLGEEERPVYCSSNDYYDCYLGPYCYATVYCLPDIFYYKFLILFINSYSIL